MKVKRLGYEDLVSAIRYNPDDGTFVWKVDPSKNVKAGTLAGTFKCFRHSKTGETKRYFYIRYKDQEFTGSQLAWLLHYGVWPERSVMFVDRDTGNLKIENLRLSDFTTKVIKKDGRSTRRITKERQRSYSLKRYYGLSLAEYASMFHKQNGVCAICNNPETEKDKYGNDRVLAVDHCHNSGKIRELLCYACNSMLGQARDNVEVLSKAIDYLNRHAKDEELGDRAMQTGLADAATDCMANSLQEA